MKHDLTSLTDGELATLSIAKREDAFAEIVRRYQHRMYRVAFASLGDPDDALDVVQDAFIAAHRALKSFDTNRAMRPWLVRIALNRCRDRLRHRRVRRLLLAFSATSETIDSIADDQPGQDRTASDRQELAHVMRAISDLPIAIREPLILRTIEGLSQADTATTLGISEKAVETRLSRARERLRAQLHLSTTFGSSGIAP